MRTDRRHSNIEVVSGLYAWNEDVVGAEIGATKGKATPMPAAVQERLIRIWASPQGAPKAAVAGTTEKFMLGANPGTLFADGLDEGGPDVRVVAGRQAGRDVPDSWRSRRHRDSHARCEVHDRESRRHAGTTTTEFTYSDYKDWNNPLNKIEVFYAGKLTERKNGAVVRDLTTDETETGNVYVVAPVPASVKKAITVTGQIPKGVFAKPEAGGEQVGAHTATRRAS